ncbi:hypothetical protein FACS1894139_14320 [Planctomycetales bacterium]|nr:hypothetical protein FACS1894107_08750 [Planctomycetales bacterium]GHS98282.1 hypothetical protein FACS1894108_06150 [Planctomycetales bacterium]GHT07038.1 hypothetical protein FACS1894139_14320 [Planctomycetales bacterium]
MLILSGKPDKLLQDLKDRKLVRSDKPDDLPYITEPEDKKALEEIKNGNLQLLNERGNSR